MNMIELHHVTKYLHGNKVTDDVTLRLYDNKIYGIKGYNGSGKTMLLRLICGIIYPDSGYVKADGWILGEDMDFPKSMGILIENPAFIENMDGVSNLKLLASLGEKKEIDYKACLDSVGLNNVGKKPYKKYSLGMKQRLGIACAVMGKPELIVLDEPTNALDENGVQTVRKLLLHLKEPGRIIIVASHERDFMRGLCDVLYEMEDGRIKNA